MAKRRKRTEKQKTEKEIENLKQIFVAINSLSISVQALRNILIEKNIATIKELDDEWDKLWEFYNKPKRLKNATK